MQDRGQSEQLTLAMHAPINTPGALLRFWLLAPRTDLATEIGDVNLVVLSGTMAWRGTAGQLEASGFPAEELSLRSRM